MVLKPAKKVRGRPVDLPPWWLVSARRKAQGWSLTRLAAALTDVSNRKTPWDHTTVGNFLKNEHATLEMMHAFCFLFEGLIEPLITARSFEEAHDLQLVARRYDSNPETASRKVELDKGREQLEKQLADQTAQLDSQDEEGVHSRRRPRGVARGRSQSS